MKINIALVGLGRAGTFHMNCLAQSTDQARLVWVVDINSEAIERALTRFEGCKGCTSIDEALADPSVDALIVASTTHQHADHIRKGLEAGKAVFSEKPISFDSNEIKEVVDLALSKKLPFMVGFQRRFDTNFDGLKKKLEGGALGTPRMIRCTSRDNPEPPMAYLAVSGGIFHDMLCHDFDMLYYLTGQLPCSVYSVGHCYNPSIADMGDCDTAMCTFTYPSGLIASVDTSRIAAYGYDQRVEVFGEKGMAQCGNVHSGTVTVADVGGFSGAPLHHSFPERYPQAYLAQCQRFLRMVREHECPTADSLQWLMKLEAITSAAEKSWKTGAPVTITY